MHALADLLPGEYILPPQRKGFACVSREATDAFVQPRRAGALGTAEGHVQARVLLESAIAAAPEFAMAHASLAATMGNLSMYEQVTPQEAWRVGSAASRRRAGAPSAVSRNTCQSWRGVLLRGAV